MQCDDWNKLAEFNLIHPQKFFLAGVYQVLLENLCKKKHFPPHVYIIMKLYVQSNFKETLVFLFRFESQNKTKNLVEVIERNVIQTYFLFAFLFPQTKRMKLLPGVEGNIANRISCKETFFKRNKLSECDECCCWEASKLLWSRNDSLLTAFCWRSRGVGGCESIFIELERNFDDCEFLSFIQYIFLSRINFVCWTEENNVQGDYKIRFADVKASTVNNLIHHD